MNYYLYLTDKDEGTFSVIPESLLFLYTDMSLDDLKLLTDEEYEHYLTFPINKVRYIDGQFVELVEDNSDHEEILILNQNLVWESIKKKRYNNLHSGCYVKSVNKWFHTDEPSRIQYLTLNTLPKLPSDLNWKTMDNSFITMTDELLNELTMTLLQKEQQDFANAERHRLAMLESDNPLEYDFSQGWSATYEPE